MTEFYRGFGAPQSLSSPVQAASAPPAEGGNPRRNIGLIFPERIAYNARLC
jgi:hypothetical protein